MEFVGADDALLGEKLAQSGLEDLVGTRRARILVRLERGMGMAVIVAVVVIMVVVVIVVAVIAVHGGHPSSQWS
jgi:hypothetical protein